ncbi:unnamed protein product [Rhizoctonia solani]|uniref:BTB domain-containing protein n=2 Tax=Rhizoctonia solani TaxID=456999 RepID=A0A8H3H471_9AGAM|nr:unnamed protein product [Rhizoctonia solani]
MSGPLKANSDNSLPVFHSKFFFEDSMVMIQIENVLFKVHKSKLVKSEVFSDMFAIADDSHNGNKPIEGHSVDNPIKLEGVSAQDFEALLTFLYESHCTPTHPALDISHTLPALRLAHMWNFSDLRAFLLPRVEGKLSDVDKIYYAREFDVERWIIPAYIKLCQRNEPLSSKEAERIGLQNSLLIFHIREERFRYPTTCSCRSPARKVCNNCRGSTASTADPPEAVVIEKIKNWRKNGHTFK